MPMKDLLQRLQPLQIYIVLTLSTVFFVIQLFVSQSTHALTLLVASYHMLCNIIALTGCIITIKQSARCTPPATPSAPRTPTKSVSNGNFAEICEYPPTADHYERSLRNTFGWTRIDILTMLIVCILLAALCFSLLVEAVQTLIHIDHQDAMHAPLAVVVIGALGLVVNGLAYLLIGGYTSHQCSFLHITPTGDVVLDRATGENLRESKRSFSRGKRELGSGNSIRALPPTTKSSESVRMSPTISTSQVLAAMIRDICSSIFVIICAIIVYFVNDGTICKLVDPIISIVSCVCLLFLSYPYMKESCLILLQTIPGSIDIDVFKADLLRTFEPIVSVHDLHIWQLTASKYVSTVHITFQTPSVYAGIKDSLENFFHDQGITIVTIQPEFVPAAPSELSASSKCLFECQSIECAPKTCCSTDNLLEAVLVDGKKTRKCKHNKYSKKAAAFTVDKMSTQNAGKKFHSFLSLNVASLSNLARLNGASATSSSNDMKKCISESHVANMSMNPNGRDGKRLSEASLTESCTSDCDHHGMGDGDVGDGLATSTPTIVTANGTAADAVGSSETPNASQLSITMAAADNDEVPEKYRANYAKKMEAESKSKSSSKSRGGEANGLLNSGDDESMTQEATAGVAVPSSVGADGVKAAAANGGGGGDGDGESASK